MASKHLTILAAALAFAGCTPIVSEHGYIPPAQELARLQIGVDTRDTVAEAVGRPSTSGVTEGDWYYVASTRRTFGPFAPRITAREVVAITYDDAGRLANVERFGLREGRVVALSRRVTQSTVRRPGFLSQLLTSVGRLQAGDFLAD
ncbi:Beta-barrel assembly machine subunit BamE [Hasllibacter halocynthiae]|uniref:Beta-barrel assembly machine subunit BamE n=1 Tax=Hasllibacter halocynthiae TaxID=595589 RepID=A0A2T0X7H6_9RHOB|nr:outer membrane protein assembly factor BamE [Hasllibacter halocynthiae]PRY94898.1 Beta-barrel assembly machine subunit BamE [Hasllibacter halocynthiae]